MKNQVITSGPDGGVGGHIGWNDGHNDGVRQVKIYWGRAINSIQIEYEKNGRSVWSTRHGDDGGQEKLVTLDYPEEYLVSISGHYGEFSDIDLLGIIQISTKTIVKSLTLNSNKSVYGPFGTTEGIPFSSPAGSGEIIGFHGRCGGFLDSIGAYFELHESTILVGPFGDSRVGQQWDDKELQNIVRTLRISYGNVVNSILIEYDDNGRSWTSQKHGGEGEEAHTITLEYPSEYLVSISGHCGEQDGLVVVRSLTLQSNKKPYGPYGTTRHGNPFSTPLGYGKIVGFDGSSENFLHSIGARFEPHQSTIPVGPFGDSGERQWDNGTHTAVKQLIIYYESEIKSIEIEYDDNGNSVWSPNNIGRRSGTRIPVRLDPDEFIRSISGYYETVLESADRPALRALAIQTNKRTQGPYGVEKGYPFSTSSTIGKVTGFFGKCNDDHLVSIGAYLGPFPVGPYGGEGGVQWNDGTYSGVKRIHIFYSSVIDSIQIVYDDNGSSILSEKHGDSPASSKRALPVNLDYPDEFLLSVRGHFGTVDRNSVIGSLTFESNRTTYGPFGVEDGAEFNFQSTGGKIIGFHGRSSNHLYSIGAYLTPVMNGEDLLGG